MADVFVYQDNKLERRAFSSSLLQKNVGKLWIDIESGEKEIKSILGDLGIHHLVIEDCIHERTRPKLESFPGYVHIVIFPVDDKLVVKQLNIIFSKNFIVTVHSKLLDSVRELKRDTEILKDMFANSIGFIVHYLVDKEIDSLFPIIDKIGDKLDDLEDEALNQSSKELIKKLFKVKTSLVHLRKITIPQREIVLKLMNIPDSIISEKTKTYFSDVYDHLMWINDNIESYRETVSGITEIYLSTVSNRMNEVMKVLTVISTIVLPLTLITGLYGMNFDFMPELRWRYGYFLVLLVMALLAIIMIFVFRRKRWI